MKNPDLFSKYQKEYQELKGLEPYPYTKQIPLNAAANLLFFEGQGEQTFLIIPSIFNSYEILTIGAPLDMVTHLRKMGSVYILEWLEIEDKDFSLDNYALVAAEALAWVSNFHQCKVCLVGHCLGGNLAVAASLIHKCCVASLVLLTTPWDFRHFAAPKALYDSIGLAKAVEGLDHIPAIYMQILFFLLSPESFEQKLDFYETNQEDPTFFAVERWQFSGHAIPRKAYDQLMDEWIDGNIIANGLWKIAELAINPSELIVPIAAIICKKDKLVPCSSANIWKERAEVFEYNTGHIGYLVGSHRKKFLSDLENWIKKSE